MAGSSRRTTPACTSATQTASASAPSHAGKLPPTRILRKRFVFGSIRNTCAPVVEPTQTASGVTARPAGAPPVLITRTTRFRRGSMRLTCPLPLSVDQTAPNAKATSYGAAPTAIRRTARVFGLMRSIVFEPKPSTQTLPAPTASPHGFAPTRMLAVTRFDVGSIRAIRPGPKIDTQTAPNPSTAAHGWMPVRIVAAGVAAEAATTDAIVARITTAATESRPRETIRIRSKNTTNSYLRQAPSATPPQACRGRPAHRRGRRRAHPAPVGRRV